MWPFAGRARNIVTTAHAQARWIVLTPDVRDGCEHAGLEKAPTLVEITLGEDRAAPDDVSHALVQCVADALASVRGVRGVVVILAE